MSDTPRNADESKKLLDNGWAILLYKNQLGSYTAEAARLEKIADEDGHIEFSEEGFDTDDFEPSQALYRITEKVFGNIA